MQTFVAFLLFSAGIFFTVKGGDRFVEASSNISVRFGIPPFVVGATVVSLATAMPEILVSLISATKGKNAMAVGNAVGSVTANTGLIMALSLIFLPAVCRSKNDQTKAFLMLLCTAALFLFSRSGSLGIIGCAVLFFLLSLFIFDSVKQTKSEMCFKRVENSGALFADICGFLFGAAGIITGARLLVDNASTLARSFGISETVISVTAVALGTSLPELVTTLSAIAKRQALLSVGNVIGANIIDTTIILPCCAVLSGEKLPINRQAVFWDIPVCFLLTATAVIPALLFRRFFRRQGVLMLAVYIAYIIFIIFKGV